MRKERGFTLIELAIVLVIIGIIIGMVLKGQDLIQNARMKRLITEARNWEVSLWTCLDRMGQFPGDTNNDGLIDANPLNATACPDTNAACNCFRNLANAPEDNAVTLGSSTFYVYVGNDGSRNVLVSCVSNGCSATLDDVTVDFARTFDSSIDGTIDDRLGIVRGATGVNLSTDVVTGVTVPTGDTTTDWDTGTGGDVAIVYYFDRKP